MEEIVVVDSESDKSTESVPRLHGDLDWDISMDIEGGTDEHWREPFAPLGSLSFRCDANDCGAVE